MQTSQGRPWLAPREGRHERPSLGAGAVHDQGRLRTRLNPVRVARKGIRACGPGVNLEGLLLTGRVLHCAPGPGRTR